MIMIDSKAGQQWARAFIALKQAKANWKDGESSAPFCEAYHEFEKASDVLGEELIADRHHEVEGD